MDRDARDKPAHDDGGGLASMRVSAYELSEMWGLHRE